jgi:hypothetical protein
VTGKLTDLAGLYDRADLLTKQRLVNLVFNNGLAFRLNSFITHRIMDIFGPKALLANKKGLLLISNPSGLSEESTFRTPMETTVELFELLKAV